MWGMKNVTKLQLLMGLSSAIILVLFVSCAEVPKIPALADILKGEPAITTSLSDAVTEVPFLDDFNPKELYPMTGLPRGPNGGFLLHSGLFQFNAQSYCLHAGKYIPGGGDGYLYAPLKGPRADIVRNLLQRSVNHPEIHQRDIQVLLWAIVSRTKIREMPPEMQLTAGKLLTPDEIFQINGGALGLIPEELLEKAFENLPDQVRQVLEAEAHLRGMLTEGTATYEQLERMAVLQGDPSPGEGSREVPRGRWSYHPDGYFIRYFPSGYTRTLVQIYVPERFQITRDELGRITEIIDRRGDRIETEYNDAIEPVAVPGDEGIRAYPFRLIRFIHRKIVPDNASDLEVEWGNSGWTFVGVPSGRGRLRSVIEPYLDIKERYEWAKTHRSQLENLDAQFSAQGNMADIMDLGHLTLAIKKTISLASVENREWAMDHIYLLSKAWQQALCKRLGGCQNGGEFLTQHHQTPEQFRKSLVPMRSSEESLQLVSAHNLRKGNHNRLCEYPPGGNMLTPGNTWRQRLEISSSPSEEDSCENRVTKCMEDAYKELEESIDECLPEDLPDTTVDCSMPNIATCYIDAFDDGDGRITSTQILQCLSEGCEVVKGAGASKQYSKLGEASFPGKDEVLSCLDTAVRAWSQERAKCIRDFMDCED
jgi:hypothetical protein